MTIDPALSTPSLRNRAKAGRALLSALVLIGAAACGDDLPTVDCASAAVPTFLQLGIIDSCTACHSSRLTGPARRNAPEDIDFDTFEAAKKDAKEGASQVAALKMPYPSGQGVTEEQRQQFYRWALCGTPE